MAAERRSTSQKPRSKRPPATTPESRENQLVAKAMDLAEKQIEEGTASAQVITHFIRIGSTRERLEKQMLAENIELQKAKREAMASAARVEELYSAAIGAMRAYAGQAPLEMVDDGED